MNKLVGRALLVSFLALDVLLVIGMARHVNQTPPVSDIPAAASPTDTQTRVKAGRNTFKFNPSQSWTIGVADDGTLAYSSRGSCDGDAPAQVWVSTDAKSSPEKTDAGLSEVLAISAVSRSDVTIVGATSTCDLVQRRSSDGGSTWQTDEEITLWHPALDDPKVVVTPDGRTRPGCTVTSLSEVGNGFGRVTCVDGTLMGSGNSGKKWVKLGRLENVRVATFSTFNAGYALAVYQGCAANEFSTRDSGRTWTPGGCISGEPAQAIDASDAGAVAIVDDEFYASEDNGMNWQQP